MEQQQDQPLPKLPSIFGGSSTADDVSRDIRLDGKNVLVTGANTGIGKECCRVFYKMGANVYMLCRNQEKCIEARTDILNSSVLKQEERLVTMQCDLASLASVRQFGTEWANHNKPIHILLNNAGVMACPRSTTVDGFEMQFGTNHLGHFLLTNLLIPYLKMAGNARVVNVSSHAHTGSPIRFDICGKTDVYDQWFGNWLAYSISKTANILFTVELDRRLKKYGIRSNAVHPGVITTDLGRHSWAVSAFYSLGSVFLKNIPQGSATSLFVCSAPELEGIGGKYFSDCQFYSAKDYATNPDTAAELWGMSAKMVNLPAGEE